MEANDVNLHNFVWDLVDCFGMTFVQCFSLVFVYVEYDGEMI